MPPFRQRPKRNGQQRNGQASHNGKTNAPRHQPQNNPADWQRQYDRYCALAQDGADQIAREHFWQYAEHFKRLMNGSSA